MTLKARFRQVCLISSCALLIAGHPGSRVQAQPEKSLEYTEALQLLKQGQYALAAEVLERSLKQQSDADTLFALGVAYRQLNQSAKAYQAYQKALSLLPTTALRARIRSGLGDIYFENADYENAQAAYQDALAFEATWSGVRLKLAMSYLRSGRLNDALNESEYLLQSAIGSDETAYLRSLIFLAKDQRAEAIQALMPLSQGKAHPEAYQALNWLYRLQYDYERAFAIADQGLNMFEHQAAMYQLASETLIDKLYFCRPQSCYQAQDSHTARTLIERWILLSPDAPQAYYQLGRLEQFEQDYTSAYLAYQKAADLLPEHFEYRFAALQMRYAKGDRPQAQQDLKALLQTHPAAKKHLRQISLWPAPEIWDVWWPESQSNGWQSYLQDFKQTATTGDTSAESQVIQALDLWQAKQYRWALTLLQQAYQQAPNWSLPATLAGKLLLESDPQQALPWLQSAYRLNPLSLELALLLARYLPDGHERQAHFTHALQSFPENSELQDLFLKQQTTLP